MLKLSVLISLILFFSTNASAFELERYFYRGELKTLYKTLFFQKDYSTAISLLEHFISAKPRPKHRQARFLLAFAKLNQKRYIDAAEDFEDLIQSYPLLIDYSRYYAAKANTKAKRYNQAEATLSRISKDSPLQIDATLLRAKIKTAQEKINSSQTKAKDALLAWKDYLKRSPFGGHASIAHFRSAQYLIQLKQNPTEIISHLKFVLIYAPESTLAKKATHLLKAFPGSDLTENEKYRRAKTLFRMQRNRASEHAFANIAQRTSNPHLRCKAQYHRAKSIFKQRQRDRAAPFFFKAKQNCHRVRLDDYEIKSRYNYARGLYRKRKYKEAAQSFLEIERRFSTHSYADDSLLRAAEAYAEIKKWDKVERILANLNKKYPNGDQSREALWRLAFHFYLNKKYHKALRYLTIIIEKKGKAKRYYAEGRALYWKARIFDRLRKSSEARSLYRSAIEEYPLSFYALLSFNRLAESYPKTFFSLKKKYIAPILKSVITWKSPLVPHGNLFYKRGIELLRLGFGKLAFRELSKAGFNTKANSKDQMWAAAMLYHHAEQWHLSHQVPRSRDWRYKRYYPLDEYRLHWTVAYPQAFKLSVISESKSASIPHALAWSIMREESGFLPTIESYANAIGLMQMILPTARAAGSLHHIDVDRKKLKDPAVNIKLGTTFLSFLWKTFHKKLPLAIAGYNAGHGAVYRWLKKRGHYDLDVFLETIPYDQTRRYTKRVLASYFAYSVLYGSKSIIPQLTQKLPKIRKLRAFGGKIKKRR